ncbi:MAG: NADH:ubiquinone reductase (Na(+)-transporting) subunit A, partial [Bacteroidota bacterium]|nr:NADH:ubiquinone reductase (Na(+)-transporting) subunit A [Bacteroidota bacterium]
MPASVKIRKGLDIRLKGGAHGESHAVSAADRFSLHPTDFHGLVPRMAVKAGAEVKAGDVLFTDKKNPEIQFVSAISGTVQEPVRGEKRRILRVDVLAGGDGAVQFDAITAGSATEDAIRSTMLAHGFWPMLRQRPFDVMPAPDSTPRDIFVSAHDSAPLAPTAAQVVGGRLDDLKKGIAFLNTLLGDGKKVQLGIEAGDDTLASLDGAEVTAFSGPHPSGNVGVQIHGVAPMN